MLNRMMAIKQSFTMGKSLESYISGSYATLHNSSSVTQFLLQPKGSISLQPNNNSNRINLSLCQIAPFSKNSLQYKSLRNSKSCAKGNMKVYNKADLASTRLISIYGPEKKLLSREVFTSAKKLRTSKSRKGIIYRDLIKKPHNNTLPFQFTITNRKNFIKADRRMSDNILKKSQDTEHETAANTADNKINHGKTLIIQLLTSLNLLERQKGKCGIEELLKKKYEAIDRTINEVINVDSKYNDVIKQIQVKIQELFMGYEQVNKDIKRELEEEKGKQEEFKIEREKLATEIKKMEVANNRLNEDVKKKIEEMQEFRKNAQVQFKGLSFDLNELYKENKKLASIANQLYLELKKTKKDEAALIQRLNKSKKSKEETKIIEIGKNKVKMPTLNISGLIKKKPVKLKVVKYYKGVNNSSEESSEDRYGGNSQY